MSNIISVSALTKYLQIKFQRDTHLQHMTIRGELSNVKMHNRGHLYFTLKDEYSRISGVMFDAKNQRSNLEEVLSDGQSVIIEGQVKVYEVNGTYQLYAKHIELDGVGLLQKQFQALKQQFEKQGYFDAINKKAVPKRIMTLGIVTAKDGAAIADIKKSLHIHAPHIKLVLYPAQVQGDGASAAIAKQIQKANEDAKIEALVIGRGGGSLEDLWAFNTPEVVEAVFKSQLPIISAVGHDVDYSLSDFTADYRAATPTAAIYYFSGTQEVISEIRFLEQKMKQLQTYRIQQYVQRVHDTKTVIQKYHPRQMLNDKKAKYVDFSNRLKHLQMEKRIETKQQHLVQIQNKAKQNIDLLLSKKVNDVELLTQKIIVLNPLSQLQRGYTLVYDKSGALITRKRDIKQPELIIRFNDGDINVKVEI